MLLSAASISKAFAGVRALEDVSFDLRPGEVHALVGENGAGKSTLIKVITGAMAPDRGELVVNGRAVESMDPSLSRALGIAAIYQQPSLFPDLTVAENIALALETGGPWRRLNWRARTRRAAELLGRIGAAIDPERRVETLSMPEQQIVEIAKALGADARIVIMDEPTASLTEREVEHLIRTIAMLKSHGVGIIYISHRLEEVFAVADRITVLRDGRTIETCARGAVDKARLIQMMVGRELSAVFPKRAIPFGPVGLEVSRLSQSAAGIDDVSFSVRQGEILGIAGLVGSGRTQLAETLFGLTPADNGEVRIRGEVARLRSPQDAIRAGIAYVPEDRRQHGVVLDMSVAANASLASLDAVSANGLIEQRREQAAAEGFVEQLRIKTSSVEANAGTLSGGNQQKVALARWLATKPSVLILDEPTQGVDVGSKAEIHSLMQSLAEQGLAIVMISSELPEILGMSDRVAVMRGGRIRGILDRSAATQESVMALAVDR
jgi:rhamnose transport system ATP-binding protein